MHGNVEMPVIDDLEQDTAWSDRPPVKFEEQEMDIAAFELWRERQPSGGPLTKRPGNRRQVHEHANLPRRLSGIDAAFLYLERKEIPLHIAGVCIFEDARSLSKSLSPRSIPSST